MQASVPLVKDIVLIGGGHTHVLVAQMWGMLPVHGARLTLINPGPCAAYSGMLPGHVAGHYSRETLDIDLVRLAQFAKARLILGAMEGLDPVAQTVTVNGRKIAYDFASIDIGIHSQMNELEGFSEFGVAVKPLDSFADRWASFRADVGAGTAPVAVIGAGVAGVELALAMDHALRHQGATPKITVLERGPKIVAATPNAHATLSHALRAARIDIVTNANVVKVRPDAVHLSNGQRIESRFTLGVTGARAHHILRDCALPLTDDGFIRTQPNLMVEGFSTLFAVGDCAHLSHAPRPKAGVFAVRAAPILLANLQASLSGGKPRRFDPQGDYLKLITLGGKRAVAQKWGHSIAGPGLWRWKDRIDRKFMRKFTHLPQMPVATPKGLIADGALNVTKGGAQPLCGGCGSKVGAGALSAALAGLPMIRRPDVLAGAGDDAAVLRIGGHTQVLTTDHLRAFWDDPMLMTRITAVHALGDIWAMGAKPQSVLVQVILPRMSAQLQERTMTEIMTEAACVFGRHGCEIVGGHTTMGAEFTLGFTVTGLAQGRVISLRGAQPGDSLVLTKPIGTGTIMAAQMQGRAQGCDVAAMLDIMAQPQAEAAEILNHANAMTDVTGFGLAGHLMAMCRSSGVGAELALAKVPLYSGALGLAQSGLHSTIYPDNMRAHPLEDMPHDQCDAARAALMHDPQTAGGLLAAIAPHSAKDVVSALRIAGFHAAVIGKITKGLPAIHCV
ncbi:selenide, water dikinase SelD [Thioclava sp. SK-1]|uniref:selenide, water dikinase SelD n=1 Tax=Thioclava sp. SK-1 TaxID=1889770 RepID=UPI000826B401|nr:selenide, water dikinase SelD [Thioclava sp. SK-1]OCX63150.1 selenide, water dikinase SelD [Thioclava sp. SK-1]